MNFDIIIYTNVQLWPAGGGGENVVNRREWFHFFLAGSHFSQQQQQHCTYIYISYIYMQQPWKTARLAYGPVEVIDQPTATPVIVAPSFSISPSANNSHFFFANTHTHTRTNTHTHTKRGREVETSDAGARDVSCFWLLFFFYFFLLKLCFFHHHEMLLGIHAGGLTWSVFCVFVQFSLRINSSTVFFLLT